MCISSHKTFRLTILCLDSYVGVCWLFVSYLNWKMFFLPHNRYVVRSLFSLYMAIFTLTRSHGHGQLLSVIAAGQAFFLDKEKH